MMLARKDLFNKYPACGIGKCHSCCGVSACELEESWDEHSQSSIVATKRLRDEVSLNKLLRLVGTKVELESLSQSVCDLSDTNSEARHLGVVAHHRNQVNDVICGTAQCYKTLDRIIVKDSCGNN